MRNYWSQYALLFELAVLGRVRMVEQIASSTMQYINNVIRYPSASPLPGLYLASSSLRRLLSDSRLVCQPLLSFLTLFCHSYKLLSFPITLKRAIIFVATLWIFYRLYRKQLRYAGYSCSITSSSNVRAFDPERLTCTAPF